MAVTPDFKTGILLLDTSDAAGIVSLPDAASLIGRTIIIKDGKQSFDTNPLTVQTSGSDTFEDGRSSLILSTKNAFMNFTAAVNSLSQGIWYINSGTNLSTIQVFSLGIYDTSHSAYNQLTMSNGSLLVNGSVISGGGGVSNDNLVSSIQGLGSSGYISSFDLASTIQGLGSSGYISSISTFNGTFASTVQGLGSAGYVSSFSLISTIQGLGSAGYVSSFSLTSTVQGLGSSGYISSISTFNGTFASTVQGLGSAGYVSSFDLASTIQGLGSLGYTSTSGSLNNALFTLTIPSGVGVGSLIFNSAQNSLYAINNVSGYLIASVESYNNVFFSCKANIIPNIGYIGLVGCNGNFSYYFTNNSGTLTTNTGGPVHAWNSNDILAISLTNVSNNGVYNFYVNGISVNSGTAVPTDLYKAAFSNFTAGDIYTNIIFSGSYGNLDSNAAVFLASYPFTQSPIYSTIQLIDTNNSSNVLLLSNYQSNLYFNGIQLASGVTSANNGLFTIICPSDATSKLFFNSATNTLVASNFYSSSNVTSLESYNNVFFSCVANINDTSALTKFGLIDSSATFSNYFSKSSGGYLYYYVNGGSNTIHAWNSNDILAISLTNQGATQTVSFYVNGTNVNTSQTSNTNQLYSAGFNYFNTGDKYSNIVFSGSYGILDPNASVFLTSYPHTSPMPVITEQFCVGGIGSNLVNSYDGINWSVVNVTSVSIQTINTVAWNGSIWVAGGKNYTPNGIILYSSDGTNWNNSANAASIFSSNVNSLAWNGTMWVAGGSVGSNAILGYSYDGNNWFAGSSVFTAYSFYVNSVAWNGTLWVAAAPQVSGSGLSTLAYSYDGINWTLCTFNYMNIYAVAWSGTQWIAVGDDYAGTNSQAESSVDGINWTTISGFSNAFTTNTAANTIAWNGSMWVVGFVEPSNAIGYSTDGQTWISAPSTYQMFAPVTSITWNGSLWIAMGSGHNNSSAYSPDGIIWTANSINTIGYAVASRTILPHVGSSPVTPTQSTIFIDLQTLNTTATLYNSNATLYFNGTALGSGGSGTVTSVSPGSNVTISVSCNINPTVEVPLPGTNGDILFNTSGSFAADTGIFTYASGTLTTPILTVSSIVASTILMNGNFLPGSTNIFTLGSPTQRWAELYIGPSSISLGDVAKIGADSNGISYTQNGFATPFITIGPAINVPVTVGAIGGWRLGPSGILGDSEYDLTVQQVLTGTGGLTGPIYSLITGPQSTIAGLGSAGYISSFAPTGVFFASTVQGLGSSSYISTQSLVSTVAGLGSSGYISSFASTGGLFVSTVKGLGSAGYISSFSLTSTIQGLGSSGYVSTSFLLADITSTIIGLGSDLYISTSGLQSTIKGLGSAGYISSFASTGGLLASTVKGLGSAGYISSYSLNSTIQGLGSAGYISSFASTGVLFASTVQGLGSAGYISSFASTGGLLASTVQGLGSTGYVSSFDLASTTQGLVINLQTSLASTLGGLGSAGYISTQTGGGITLGNLTSSIQGLGSSSYISTQSLVSTVQGLGTNSQTSLVSSIQGLGSAGYISTQTGGGITLGNLTSSIQGIGSSSYISTQSLVSTVQGLGTISQTSLVSSHKGLGSSGYLSSINFYTQSTTVALGYNAGQISQGDYAIAIGNLAGQTNQNASSIILNATTTALNNTSSGFFVAPVRFLPGSTILANSASNILTYNTTTSEIFCSDTLSITNLSTGVITGNTINSLNGYFYNGQLVAFSTGNTVYIGTTNGMSTAKSIALGCNAGCNSQAAAGAVAIGYGAGQSNQGTGAVALGCNAGQSGQGVDAIAIGSNAGCNGQGVYSIALGGQAAFYNQGTNSIALGYQTAYWNQGTTSIGIGSYAGFSNQATGSIAIGPYSGVYTQGSNAIAIGCNAATSNQGCNAIAIGCNAGVLNQSNYSIAIGYQSGCNIQSSNAIAIGFQAGRSGQAMAAIAIGCNSGVTNQLAGAIAIGNSAGSNSQAAGAIAIGCNAGSNSQAAGAIAIGLNTGTTGQGVAAIAIGCNAGCNGQIAGSVALGYQAGYIGQAGCNIAIGYQAGNSIQGSYAIAMGYLAASTLQGTSSIAIGFQAGLSNQGKNSIALGFNAGSFGQGQNAIAIGYSAGCNDHASNSIAIGFQAGSLGQSTNSLAIGTYSGYTNQGQYAVALGYGAGSNNQPTSSIAINATATPLNPLFSGFYVSPVNFSTGGTNVLSYNQITNEIFTTDTIQVSSINTSSFTTLQAVPARRGNVLTVDAVYGNDSTASIGGLPYLTVNAAITAAAAAALPPATGSGYTIKILPGTYTLTAGITIPTGCSIRGESTQTTVLQWTPSSAGTYTMITMGTQTRLEDVTINMTTATAAVNLVGIYFPTTTTTSAKVRGCTVTVLSTAVDTSTVYGVFADGTTTSPTVPLSINALQRTSVNVTSSTTGIVRGCYFTGALQVIMRDTTIFATGTGSATNVIGVECTNTGAYISIKSSSVSGKAASGTTAFDILQPSLATTVNPVIYLQATDLANGTASINGFGMNIGLSRLNFSLQGSSDIPSGQSGNLSAGSYFLTSGNTLTNTVLASSSPYFSIPFSQNSIILSASINYISASNFDTGSSMYVNLRNSTSPSTKGTIFASQYLSNGALGPFRLQNFSSYFSANTPNYLQIEVSTLGANHTINHSPGNCLFITLGIY